MYPTLPFGPLSLPTAPFLGLVAFWVGLETASRAGRRFGLVADHVWTAGLWTVLSGLIVARLWNVVQFWPIYAAQPFLIVSLRPSGFALLPGLIGGLIGGYAYLVRHALDPLRAAAAYAVGALAGGVVFALSAFLTGAVIGLPANLPWSVVHFGERVHPAALYRGFGLAVVLVVVLAVLDGERPLRTLLQAGFGYCLVRLATDAFTAQPALAGSLRLSQLVALAGALLCAGLLARGVQR